MPLTLLRNHLVNILNFGNFFVNLLFCFQRILYGGNDYGNHSCIKRTRNQVTYPIIYINVSLTLIRTYRISIGLVENQRCCYLQKQNIFYRIKHFW